MALLEDLNQTLDDFGIPFQTGSWSDKAPDKYIVITPLSDTLELFGKTSKRFDI